MHNEYLIVDIHRQIVGLNDEIVLRVRVCGQRHLFWSARVGLVLLNFLYKA